MKTCEYCGREIVKSAAESSEYFKRKRFCSSECYGKAKHKKYLERPDVQAELKRVAASVERSKELSKYCHRNYTHPVYNSWKGMRRRCNSPYATGYKNYGGRGINVCEEWDKDPLAFIHWSLEHGWKPGLTLDRIDNNGNYCPENCRWISRAEQLLNRRNNRILKLNGKSQTMKEWADELGIRPQTLSNRVNRSGWSDEKALTTPIDEAKIHVKRKRPFTTLTQSCHETLEQADIIEHSIYSNPSSAANDEKPH